MISMKSPSELGPRGLIEKLPPFVQKSMIGVFLLGMLGIFIAMCVLSDIDTTPDVGVYAVDADYNYLPNATNPDQYAYAFDYDGNVVPAVTTATTAWMLIASFLVLIMTPGLAFFYGGMINHKNVIATLAASILPMGVIPLLWCWFTYSLSFGVTAGYPEFIGNPATHGFMEGIGANGQGLYSSTFWLFQGMFAIITPAILIGAIADRVNFPALLLFVPMWHMGVYCPMAHMVFGGGLIADYGILDFAGGIVVHMSSGWGALAAALYLGPRAAIDQSGPAQIPFTVLGASLLWFGWFGFNAGSGGVADNIVPHAFLNTVIATAGSMLTWIILDQLKGRPFKVTGMAMGIVVGLVSITPGCAYVNYGAALIIGMFTSCMSWLVQWGMVAWGKTVADDTLDVFACHGIGGTFGMILTSLFQNTEYGAGVDGAFYGNGIELGKCLLVLVCVVGYFIVATIILLAVTNLFISVRATPEEEEEGLDFSKHFENQYNDEA
eukprot:363759-Chlamydomonas_euryale.AAC.31